MPETEDCPLCDGDDQECRYCGVPRIKMPETEQRKAAEEWLDKFMGTFSHPKVGPAIRLLCTENNGAWLIDAAGEKWRLSEVLANFAKERKDSALLEAAGLVCYGCAHDVPLTESGENHKSGTGAIYKCEASPIHEWRALKGNG